MATVSTGGLFARARNRIARWTIAHRRTSPGNSPAPRIKVHLQVDIRGYERRLTAESVDVAMGGMLLEPETPLSIGEPVQIGFKLPDGPRINIPGVVCRKQVPQFAIRFDVTDPQRYLIQQWVDAHLQTA